MLKNMLLSSLFGVLVVSAAGIVAADECYVLHYDSPAKDNLSDGKKRRTGQNRPLVEWTKVLAESGAHTARETFGVNQGWSVGLNGNVYGFTGQNEHGRRNQQAAHWLAQNLFDHYAFTQDRAYLAEKVALEISSALP